MNLLIVNYFLKTYFLWLLLIELSENLNIDDFGTKPNDTSFDAAVINGKAILSAINAANNGWDRTVVIDGHGGKIYTMVPAGSNANLINVTIQIDGRVNAWEGDESTWPQTSQGRSISMFSISNTQNLTIKGNGIIDGFGYDWWWNVFINGHDNRPNIFDISHGVNTIMDSITLFNAPQYHIVLDAQINCTVQNLVIKVNITHEDPILEWLPTFPLNTDGIDINGQNIYFRNLTIENYDDAVAVKPRTLSDCTENILIEDCHVKFGVGMSIGSVPPNGGNACIRNVTFRNIRFDNPLKAIYIKPNPGDSGLGTIKNITYENIEIHNALWWAVFIGTQQQQQPHGGGGTGCSFFYPLEGTRCQTDPLVTIDNIVLRNVNIYGGLLSPGVIVCNSTNPCTNFIFDNVNVYNRSMWPVKEGFYCENVKGAAINSNLFPDCFYDLTYSDRENNFLSKFAT